jgi:hypothetical protein
MKNLYKKEIVIVSTSLIDVHPELECLVSGLSVEKYSELESSILENGIEQPLMVGRFEMQSFVVDGHHRLMVALDNNIKQLPVIFKDYETLEEMKLDTMRTDVERRQLSREEEIRLALQIKDLRGLSFRETADETGIPRSTLHRVAKTIEEENKDIEETKQEEETIKEVAKAVKIPTIDLTEESPSGFRKEVLTENEEAVQALGTIDANKPAICEVLKRIQDRAKRGELKIQEKKRVESEQRVAKAINSIKAVVKSGDTNLDYIFTVLLNWGLNEGHAPGFNELVAEMQSNNEL